MFRKLCITAMVLSVIYMPGILSAASPFAKIKLPETHQTKQLSKAKAPDYASFLQIVPLLSPKVGRNGFALFYLRARIPGSEDVDTNYTGIADLVIREANPNGSAKFCYADPTFFYLPDTTRIVDSLALTNGEGAVWIKNAEAEEVICWATSRDSLKYTHPMVYAFDTSGVMPNRTRISGPTKINIDSSISGRYTVRLVDAAGKIVTAAIADTLVTVTLIESISNGSATMRDGINYMQESSTQIHCSLIGGQGNVFLFDTESEIIKLICSHTYFSTPDTITIDVRPKDEVLYAMPISFSGTYGTKNVDKNIIAGAMGNNGPDPTNNSSQIQLTLMDFFGTASSAVIPSTPQTLTSGLAIFTLQDTEADSALIVNLSCSGTPELTPHWLMGDKIAYGFKEPGEAIMMQISNPTTVIVGDTSTISLYTVDGLGTIDTSYEGWAKCEIKNDNDSSCELLEFGTGIPTDIVKIINGTAKIWTTNPQSENIRFEFSDAEAEMISAYLGQNGPENEVEISFQYPGDSAIRWIMELQGDQFLTHQLITGTIKAVDDSGLVDTTFQDSALFQSWWNVVPESAMVPISNGIGTIQFMNDSTENSILTVSGAGIAPWQDTVTFISGNQAVYLIPMIDNEVLVNDSTEITILAVTASFTIDTLWNGAVFATCADPGNASINWNGNPDSIPIIKGTGKIKMINSEVETVTVSITYKNGTYPLPTAYNGSPLIQFEAKLAATYPDSMLTSVQDTILINTLDFNDAITQYNTWFTVWCVEQTPNSSVTMGDSMDVINGTGYLEIENSEPETVWVYADTLDPLIQRRNQLIATVIFRDIGIEDIPLIPTKFDVSNGNPNPFTGNTLINYAIPVTSKVSLSIFDVTGRKIRTLVNENVKPGFYKVSWDGTDNHNNTVAAGVYFYKFETGKFNSTKKLTLIR